MNKEARLDWKLVPAIALLILSLATLSSANLNCGWYSGACSSANTELLYMYNLSVGFDNGHAQLVNYTPHYPSVLCCNSSGMTLGNRSGTAFLRLYNFTNSHVQDPGNGDLSPQYSFQAFLSSNTSPIACILASSCAPRYACLASIASSGTTNRTNAHIAACSFYSTQVCCRINSTPYIAFISPTPADATSNKNTSIVVNTTVSDPDSPSNLTAFIDWNRGLVGWWRFNNESSENSTFFRDWSSYSNNASCVIATCPAYNSSGRFSNAVSVDDTYAVANDSPSLDLSTQGTLELWAKPDRQYPSDDATTYYRGFVTKAIDGSATGQVYNLHWWGTSSESSLRSCIGNASTLNCASVSIGPLNTNSWYYFAVTWNQSSIDLYSNGTLILSQANSIVVQNAVTSLTIGGCAFGCFSGQNWDGLIDEVRVHNRALSPEEINASYSAGTYRLWKNFSGLTRGAYTYRAYAQNHLGSVNQTEQRTFSVQDFTGPTWANMRDNSTATGPQINGSIQLNVTLNDDTALSSFTFSWNGTGTWLNDSPVTISGTTYQVILNKTANFTGKPTVGWMVYFNDSASNKNQTSIATFKVKDTAPQAVSLTAPAIAAHLTNRTVTFNWTASYDVDGDTITYNWTLKKYQVDGTSGIACVDADRLITGIPSLNYTSAEINCLYDDNWYYNWTITPFDGEASGASTSARVVYIDGLVSITMLNGTIQFGSLTPSTSANTTTFSPYPLTIENDGNLNETVNISSTNLWLSASAQLPTSKYLFKVDNHTGEPGSFNASGSKIAWTNFTNTLTGSVIGISSLDWHEASDSADAHILISVPQDEAPGNKSSTITFEAKRS